MCSVNTRLKSAKKVGLALGSGSARGWSHIGVIRALAEAGIRIHCVAGTSIGAVVGAVFASGKLDAFEEIVIGFDWKQVARFFDVVFPKSGLIDGKKVADFVRGHVRGENIEDLPIPFSAVATDLGTGREVIIQDGDLIEAIRASISVPGIFTPVRREGSILADGGLVNPVPVTVAREMGADFVIAVDLNHDIVATKGIKPLTANSRDAAPGRGLSRGLGKTSRIVETLDKAVGALELRALLQLGEWTAKEPLPNIFEVLGASINIMESQITATKLKADPPDLLIQPKLGHMRFLEFSRAQEGIAEGYRATNARLHSFQRR
ncbi:MAG: patatin-like phospholipase family protein [Phycisphaerae bacterium]|nr:patatin-like phospholipase family protein [Phycisphaerae bacterium]